MSTITEMDAVFLATVFLVGFLLGLTAGRLR